MANLTVTAAKVGRANPKDDSVRTYVAATTITAGQATYLTSSGTLGLASAAAAATAQVRGIAINGGVSGQPVTVIKEGGVEGFTLTSLNYDALTYLSNTAGALADAAGTVTVRVGRVSPVTDGATKSKILEIQCNVTDAWS